MSYELTFGKYKGKPIEEVYASDSGYCRWVFNQPSLNISEEIKIFLHSKFLNNDNSYMMTWGNIVVRLLNRSVEWIPVISITSARANFVIEKCPKLLKELN
ncbi:unnamed protein product [Phytophthora lilii]|uniref:Unnamed protein product n=1 Tax=Phytophthora lilii TaxID=2077276 RepID=A0A9W7D9X1_9STRA|nr:unnamed protein product [Phytophthora lilii]